MSHARSFAPLAGATASLLILGSMPGQASLAAQQYYAHPRNAFWRIAAELFGCQADAPYGERVAALCRHGVAVWDVLRACRRAGSLDAAIERDSMVANDFDALFAEYPGIDRVFFNGAAAEANYRRLVRPTRALTYVRLPSTSPAQTMAFTDKLAAWSVVTADRRLPWPPSAPTRSHP